MELINNPERATWPELLARPQLAERWLDDTVQKILKTVRKKGDKALIKLAAKLDGAELTAIEVSAADLEVAGTLITPVLREAIDQAARNIRVFHAAQQKDETVVETMPGVRCWRRSVGIERVGLYVPGGSAPLFSTVLMLGIPAAIAGCREVILCTPPQKDGSIHPAILYAATVAGITRVFRAGGAQAVAAMAFGTESIPAVYKIFGPGNQFVNRAKQLVQGRVAIDMPAGPSEVCVLADETANPAFVAADLLSQAEHGPDSQVLLVTTSATLAEKVEQELGYQLARLGRKKLAESSIANSRIVVMPKLSDAIDLVNEYAAEHLILAVASAEDVAGRVINAGSVFIGHLSPESVGDYASGTNHTLPTNGWARSQSGVSVDSFVKKITYQQLTAQGLSMLAPTVISMALAEGLDAHAAAVTIRQSYLQNQ